MSLNQSILSVIFYFDIFDYPLTAVEVWRWLYSKEGVSQNDKFSLAEVKAYLENNEELKQKIKTRQGFYFFSGREEIVKKRLERYGLAQGKFKRALKVGKILRLIPFIRMIAVCNTLAYSNASSESDIDLFIIAKARKIWKTRFLAVGILKLLGLRPSKKKKQDKICLSFFVTEEALDLSPLALADDIYLVYWINQLVPIYDKENTFAKFVKANQWVTRYLPNSYPYNTSGRRVIFPSKFSFLGHLSSFIFPEQFCRWLQKKVMPQSLKKFINQGTGVVINDKILKLHDNDRREEYRDAFRKISNI